MRRNHASALRGRGGGVHLPYPCHKKKKPFELINDLSINVVGV